jgi:hypothetical protein
MYAVLAMKMVVFGTAVDGVSLSVKESAANATGTQAVISSAAIIKEIATDFRRNYLTGKGRLRI